MLANASKPELFAYQTKFLKARGDISNAIADKSAITSYTPSLEKMTAIASQSLLVIIIAFILSVFYGAGALFLIVLNASIFASYISTLVKSVGNAFSLTSLLYQRAEDTGNLSHPRLYRRGVLAKLKSL